MVTERKKIVYFGLGSPPAHAGVAWIVCPLIQIVPMDLRTETMQRAFDALLDASAIVVTSKVAVQMLQSLIHHHHIPLTTLQDRTFFAVGTATARALLMCGWKQVITSGEETQEGLAATIAAHITPRDHLFWGHSSRARSYLGNRLNALPCHTYSCVLYDTLLIPPECRIDFSACDALFFTSPSSVHSFLQHVVPIPHHLPCISQGPVTKAALDSALPTSKKLLYSDMLPLFVSCLENAF